MTSAAVTVLVREAPLAAPAPGVEVANSITRVLANVRSAVKSRKVCWYLRVTFVYS